MKELSREQAEVAVTCLKNIVEYRKLNQTQLEQISGVNQSTISKIFSRSSEPTFDALKKLYQALGLKLESVLHDGTDSPHDLCGYLATPLTGLTPQAEADLQRLVNEIKKVTQGFDEPRMDLYWPGEHTHPVRNADITPDLVYLTDRSRASTHDFIVIVCGAPSFGVGQENEIATQAGVPAIRIAPKGISRMMVGSFIRGVQVEYSGSLEKGNIVLDVTELRKAFETVRRIHFKHRALFKCSGSDSFGARLKRLIDDRVGDYRLMAEDIGIGLSYLHVLMEESIGVSNPSARLLGRMAIRLGTSVSYLLGETEATDPVWVESNASWRRWIEESGADAAGALAVRDEWRQEYRINQSVERTPSFPTSSTA